MAFSMAGSGLGPAINAISKALGFGPIIGLTGTESVYEAAKAVGLFNEGIPWTYSGQDWYKVFPYAFVVEATNVANDDEPENPTLYTYTLPIPPQTMLTKMIPASAATATFGGVVEETSDNVFWIIQMSGTTGTAVSRSDLSDTESNRKEMAKLFRKKLETTGLLSGVAAQLNSLAGKVGGTLDAAAGAATSFASGDIAGGMAGVTGAINNLILPALPYSESGVDGITNGFTEMQELHRFLYTFSHLKAKMPDQFKLKFKNYKTGQEWRIILQDFTIQQSAQQPNLYRYNIQLKAWDVKTIDSEERSATEYDRFKPGSGDLAPVNVVGIDGIFKAYKAYMGTYKGDSKSTIAEGLLK